MGFPGVVQHRGGRRCHDDTRIATLPGQARRPWPRVPVVAQARGIGGRYSQLESVPSVRKAIASGPPMWKLVIEDDEGKRTVVPLSREQYSIGRKDGNTIRLT